MTIEIKHRYSGITLFTHGGETLRWADLQEANLQEADLQEADLQEANLRGADLRGADLQEANLQEANLRRADLRWANLRWANLRGANLQEANLRGADLRGADLRGADLQEADLRRADLWGTTGNSKEICNLFCTKYPITWTSEVVQIGCQRHTKAEWLGFSDDEIANMDSNALTWWREWKPKLQALGVFDTDDSK